MDPSETDERLDGGKSTASRRIQSDAANTDPWVTIEYDGGRAIVVKRAHRPDGIQRLRHEADVLERARHPGVVELLEFTGPLDPHATTTAASTPRTTNISNAAQLVLVCVGAHTLETWPCSTPQHAAGLVATLATTVADLHDLGIKHGRITADHVLINAQGQPILTGWAEAAFGPRRTAGGGDYPEADAGDEVSHSGPPGPPGPSSEPSQSSTDVAALGDLLRNLIISHPESVAWIPDHRWHRAARSNAAARRALLTLADHASADDARIRPTARRLAATILAAVPDARLIGGDAVPRVKGAPNDSTTPFARALEREIDAELEGVGLDNHDTERGAARSTSINPTSSQLITAAMADDIDRRPIRRGVPGALCLLGVLLVVFGVSGLRGGEHPILQDAKAPLLSGSVISTTAPFATDASVHSDDEPTSSPPPVAATGRPDKSPGPSSLQTAPETTNLPSNPSGRPSTTLVAATAARCPVVVPSAGCTRVLPAGVIEHDRRRYSVGEPGDELVIGPFLCDPHSNQVALLRPSTGEVFFFAHWASGDSELRATAAGIVNPQSHWLPTMIDHNCAGLLVESADGILAPVALPTDTTGTDTPASTRTSP